MMFLLGLAQAAAVAAAPPPAQTGVISYPASYFVALQSQNASEMLGRLPGFTLERGNSSRGFEGSAGNVLIDGQRPASKTDSLDEILKRMPIGVVERIDLIRGGAPGIDMQGKTVLANVIRKKGAGTRLLFAVAQSHDSDGRTVAAERIEGSGNLGPSKWEFGTFYGRGLDDGNSGDGPGVTVHANGVTDRSDIKTEADGQTAFGSGSVETPVLGGSLRVNGRLYTDKYKYDEQDVLITPTPGEIRDNWVQRTDDTEIGGAFNRGFGANTNIELVGLRQTRDRDYDEVYHTVSETDVFALRRESSEAIARGVVKYRFTPRLSFEAGAETALNKLDSRTRFSIDRVAQDLPAADVQVEEKRSEVFTKATWRPTSQWTLDGGLRYETSTITSRGDVVLGKDLHYLKPRLAATWAPREATQVRLRVEREVGQLNFDDFVASSKLTTASGVTAGNPNLDPQQAWVAEAAIEQRFWGSGSVVLTARHSRLKDVVDRGPVFSDTGVFDAPTNIGSGTLDDLGLTATVPLARFGLKGLEVKGDVTKHWSSVTDPTTGEKREISGQHPIDWNLSFSYDMPAQRFRWGVNLYGGIRESYYRFNLIDTVKFDSYLAPFAEWRATPTITIRAELDNATARDVRTTDLVYPGPRNAGGKPDVQDRNLKNGRIFYVRVRKTLGG
jgi:outer membrane receptor protein involved in Fe transport